MFGGERPGRMIVGNVYDWPTSGDRIVFHIQFDVDPANVIDEEGSGPIELFGKMGIYITIEPEEEGKNENIFGIY